MLPLVRQRIQISVAVLLAFIATGSQWDFVQTFAWGRMLVNYSRTMTVSQSIAKTFSGEMCDVCRLVASTQRQDRTRSEVPAARADAKLFLFLQSPSEIVLACPAEADRTPRATAATTVGRAAPLLPPPRRVAA
jgi:hypothetical protein